MQDTEIDSSAPLESEKFSRKLRANKIGAGDRASENLIAKIAYFIMCYSWIFDFRSEGAKSGLATQQFFLIIYLAAFVPFLISYKGSGVKIRGLDLTIIFSLFFLLIGTISGLINDQEYYQIFRNSINIFIYITMVYTTSKIVVLGDRRSSIYFFLFLTFFYSVSTFIIYYIRQGGIDFTTIRFQIIGSSSIAALALISLSFLYRLPLIAYVSIITTAAIVFISITRTYVFVAVTQLYPVLKNARRVFGPREIILSFVLITLIPSIYVYTEFFSNRWEERVSVRSTSTDIDPTLYARMDEWNFMVQRVFESPKNAFFGSGFAAITEYYLPNDISKEKESDIGFGHSNHISLIFIAGFLGGGPLLILHFVQFGQALRFLSDVISGRMKDSDILFLGAWGALILIGTFIANILAAAFTNRGTSLWFAIGTGLFLGGRACFDPQNINVLRRSMPNFYLEKTVVRRHAQALARAKKRTSDLKSEQLPDAVLRRRSALSEDQGKQQCPLD